MSITSGFKKFKNHIKNGDGTYSLQSLWTSAQTVECADGTTVEDKIGGLKGISTDLETTEAGYAADMTVVGQLNRDIAECFQSVSDGKSLIAAAITDKGISTAADATFNIIADNIANISTGYVTATASMSWWGEQIGSFARRNFTSYSSTNSGIISTSSTAITFKKAGYALCAYCVDAYGNRTIYFQLCKNGGAMIDGNIYPSTTDARATARCGNSGFTNINAGDYLDFRWRTDSGGIDSSMKCTVKVLFVSK